MADLTLKKVFEFLRKVDEINISSEARDLLIHYMTHQGKDYVFHNDFIADQKGWSRQYMERYKKELVTENLIFSDFARENGKRVGTRVIVNYDFPNVIISNVSNPNVSNPNVRKSNVRKPNVRKANVSSANVRKPDVLESKKINREEENRREGENPQSGPSLSERPAPPENTAPADIPAGTQTALFPETLPADIPPASIPEPEKASTKFIPPTKAEVRAKLEAVLTEKGTIQHWTDSDLQSFTDQFYDWYDSANWLKNDGRKMKDWQRALSVTWLAKREYLPEKAPVPAFPGAPVNQQRQPPKSFKQQDLDYANRRFNDPAGAVIRAAVDACLGMGGDDPCEYGLPEQFREQAIKLLQEERRRLSQSFNPFPDFPELPEK
jgi:hypothetical protein